MKITTLAPLLSLLILFNASVHAQKEQFVTGPVFKNYGANVEVQAGLDNPQNMRFKVLFDVYSENTGPGANRAIDTAARFINMHVRAGVPKGNIQVAMVVHGKASVDLLKPTSTSKANADRNGSAELVELLLAEGVEIYLCGQSAAFLEIGSEDLIDGVQMSLSAMTANALLQQRGYTLNPF